MSGNLEKRVASLSFNTVTIIDCFFCLFLLFQPDNSADSRPGAYQIFFIESYRINILYLLMKTNLLSCLCFVYVVCLYREIPQVISILNSRPMEGRGQSSGQIEWNVIERSRCLR